MTKLTNVAEIELTYRPFNNTSTHIHSPLDAYNEFKKIFPENTIGLQEMVVVMYLNRNNKILGLYKVSIGGLTSTVADIRLILGTVLKIAASGLMLCHNHPSGNLQPSMADKVLTERLKDGCRLLDLKLLDHLILSQHDTYLSFADEGLL